MSVALPPGCCHGCCAPLSAATNGGRGCNRRPCSYMGAPKVRRPAVRAVSSAAADGGGGGGGAGASSSSAGSTGSSLGSLLSKERQTSLSDVAAGELQQGTAADTAGSSHQILPQDAAERLIASCVEAAAAAPGEGSELDSCRLKVLELHAGMLAAGQQPSKATNSAALAAAVHALAACQQQAGEVLGTLRYVLLDSPQVSTALSDGEWDVVAAAAVQAGDASFLCRLLTEQGAALQAMGRQQLWNGALQLAAAAISRRGRQTLAEAVEQWTAVDVAAGVLPMPELSPALQLALMAAHHTPGSELQAALDPLVEALSSTGRTAELLQAFFMLQAATRGAYRPSPQHLSEALLSARQGPLWGTTSVSLPLPQAGSGTATTVIEAGTAGSPAGSQKQQGSSQKQAAAGAGMCLALLATCQKHFVAAGGAKGPADVAAWASQLSTGAQLVLLRVLCQLGDTQGAGNLCKGVDWRHAPSAEAAAVLSTAIECTFFAWLHQQQQEEGPAGQQGHTLEPGWLPLASAALVVGGFEPGSPAVHEALAAARVAGGSFLAGWEALCSMASSKAGVPPHAATIAWVLHIFAQQLRELRKEGEEGSKAADKLLCRTEEAGLLLAAGLPTPLPHVQQAQQQPMQQPQQAQQAAEGSIGGNLHSQEGTRAAHQLPPLTPEVLEGLLAVYYAARTAGSAQYSVNVAAVIAAAAEQGVPLSCACCELLVQLWEAAEEAAAMPTGAVAEAAAGVAAGAAVGGPSSGSASASASASVSEQEQVGLEPLLVQVLGKQAVEAIEEAAYGCGQERLLLDQPRAPLAALTSSAGQSPTPLLAQPQA